MSWDKYLTVRSPLRFNDDPKLKTFLATMSIKFFRTTILMLDDVLCHFGFCQNEVKIKGEISTVGLFPLFFLSDLIVCLPFMGAVNKMSNAEMTQAMKRKKTELTEQSKQASPTSLEKLLQKPNKKKITAS